MKAVLIIVLSLCTFTAFGQVNWSGSWVGTITQDEGGYRSKYDFEIFLQQDGSTVRGRSFVYVDNIYAEMELVGEIHSGLYLRFKEQEIIDYKKFEGMEWCVKKGQLLLKKGKNGWLLEGFWQGNTTFSDCIPGKVYLEKKVPRA